MNELLARPVGHRSQALFCANDLLAIGAVNAATRLGVAVPDDLTIVGYDDIDFAETAGVALTTVSPARAIGRQAGELLLREVTDGAAPTSLVFAPELVICSSILPVTAGIAGTTADRRPAAR